MRIASNRFIITSTISLLCLFVSVQRASAWEQSVDEDTDNEIYQPNSCFYYSVNEQGSDDVLLSDLLDIVRTSFDAWEDVDCSYFYFMDTETTPVDRAEYNPDKGNVNLLVWRETPEEWHTDGKHTANTVALTTVQYEEDTFTILDVDIEFNGAYFDFGTASSEGNSDIMDLQAVITHEIGHTIGLADLYDQAHIDSTMYGTDIHDGEDSTGIEKRTLHQDDIDGLCHIYPFEEDPEVCEEPICGLDVEGNSTTCKIQNGSTGCMAAATRFERTDSLISRLFILF